MHMKVRHLLAVAICIAAMAVSAWAAQGLDQIAKALVDTTLASDHGTFVSDNFAKDVAEKLSKPGVLDDSEEGIDFDIFTYSQDPDFEAMGKSIKSEVKQTDDGNAVIKVTFKQFDDDATIAYRLKKSGERWLIDDIVYPDEVSLRAELGLK
jgi:hypothetical protein